MRFMSLLLIGGMLFGVNGALAESTETLTTKRPVDGWLAWDYRNHWNATEVNYCSAEESFTNEDGCLGSCSDGSNGKWAMIARSLNERGAQFCLTYVYVDRKDVAIFQRPQTKYKSASKPPFPECVWLCKDGWTGDKCETAVSATTETSCNPTLLKSTTYVGMSPGSKSVENSVAMFWSHDKDCNDTRFEQKPSTYNQEHDIVLGISSILASGHGAWVEPMTVRAWCPNGMVAKEATNVCKVIIDRRAKYAKGKTGDAEYTDAKTLVCMDGYKPNAAKTDCIVVNQSVCASIAECNKWDASLYKDTDKYKKMVVNGCNQYRCAQDGYGFDGDPTTGQRDCIECPTSVKQGISYTTGECLKAAPGQMYSNGELVKAHETIRSEMTKAGGDKPCWTLETPGEYKRCLLGISEKTDTVKIGTPLYINVNNIQKFSPLYSGGNILVETKKN